MLSIEVLVAYVSMNVIFAILIMFKSPRNTLSRFYAVGVASLVYFGVLAHYLSHPLPSSLANIFESMALFLFAIIPFLFIHFVILLAGTNVFTRSPWVIVTNYLVGVLYFLLLLFRLIPAPLFVEEGLSRFGYMFYLSWQTIYFCAGVALTHSVVTGFFDRHIKANVLMKGFIILLLLLPGPFTATLLVGIVPHLGVWFFYSSIAGLIIAIYLIFRHTIIVNTPYEALKATLAVMNDVIIKMDNTFRIELVRGAFSQMLGYEERDLSGRSLSEIVEEKNLLETYRDYVFRGKMKESFFDAQVICKNGSLRPVFFSLTPIRAGMEVSGFVAVGRDITELRQYERQLRWERDSLELRVQERTEKLQKLNELLRESEERFRTLYENSTIGLYRTTPDGRILLANPALVRMLGYSSFDGLAVRNLENEGFEPSYERSHFLGMIEKEGEVKEFEAAWTRRDGTAIFVRESARAIRDPHGKTIYYDGTIEDITEHKRTEKAFKKQSEFFRKVIDLNPSFIFAKDRQGRFTLVNQAVADAYGTTVENLLGKTDADFNPNKDEVEFFRRMDLEVMDSKQVRFIPEEKITDASGKLRWLQTVKIPIIDKEGKANEVLGVSTDITARKLADERIRKLNHTYAVLSGINQAIVRIHDPQQLFSEACGIAVEDGEFQMAWFGKLNPETQKVDVVAFAGTTNDYLSKIDIDLSDEKQSQDPTRRAIKSAAYVISNDIESDDTMLPWRENAMTLGCRSSAAFPIKVFGKAWGAFNFYSSEVGFFDADEIKLLDELAADLSFAIEFLQLESDRKQAEALLRLQSAALNAAANAIVITSRDGTIQFVNPAFTALTGYTAEEATGKNPRELVKSGVYNKAFYKNLWDTILSGKVWQGEITNRRKDGTLYSEEQSITPLFDERGEISHFIAIKQNISERKKAEKLQKTIYEIAQAATSATDLNALYLSIHKILSQLIQANNFYIALYDESSDMVSFPYFVDQFDKPIPPKKAGKGLTEYVLRTGKALLCDDTLFNTLVQRGEVEPIGEPSPIWLGVPLQIENKIIGVMAVQDYENPETYGVREREIAEYVSSQIAHAIDRKRKEEALATQKSYFQQLFEESPSGIAILDTEDAIAEINPAFERIFQYSRAEVRGKKINTCVVPAEYVTEAENLSKITQEGAMHWKETQRKRKDGTLIHVRVTGYPIVIEGKHTGVYAIYEDISEQKKLQQQFIQSQKMESLGTLASGIAHDFNNILSIIIGHASLLERLPADRSTVQRNVEAITKAGMRGANLVKQMLIFARKTDVMIESVTLNDAVNEVVILLHETFSRTITVALHLEKDLPLIDADATQLHQVMLNLCVNARDAMSSGGTLTITTQRESGDPLRAKYPKATAQSYVVLSVADTGLGMDEETQRRIFEPFFTTKERGKGTGLGLSLVFGIMESHHGFVTVQSELGKGTTFHCYFPVPHKAPELTQVKERTAEEIPGGNETILVVEDEDMLRELSRAFLESKGYAVLTAENGEHGLAVYQQHRNAIALVISDLGLPKFSGDELYRRLKLLKPDVLFILASGIIEPGMKSEIFRSGIKEFIQKPYNKNDLLRVVRRVLDNG